MEKKNVLPFIEHVFYKYFSFQSHRRYDQLSIESSWAFKDISLDIMYAYRTVTSELEASLTPDTVQHEMIAVGFDNLLYGMAIDLKTLQLLRKSFWSRVRFVFNPKATTEPR